jgi:hypothetical protein
VRLTAGSSPADQKTPWQIISAVLPPCPGRLTSTLTAVTIIVVDVSFWSCSIGSGPEGSR